MRTLGHFRFPFGKRAVADHADLRRACEGVREPLLLASAGEELGANAQAELSTHLAGCPECAELLDREKALIAEVAQARLEPNGALLGSCRTSLQDALDREEEHGWLRCALGNWLPHNWLAPRPAWSAAVLVLIGLSAGIFGPRFLRRAGPGLQSPAAANNYRAAVQSPRNALVAASSAPVASAARDSGEFARLSAAEDIAGVSILPSAEGAPRVEVQLRADEPRTIQGSASDARIQSALLSVLSHQRQFDPGTRLNAVDALAAHRANPAVRAALCQAARSDPNAAVRLKALEALSRTPAANAANDASGKMVRETLLDALVGDRNPGVRVEAVNALREMAQRGMVQPDGHVISILRERMQRDPSTYIRFQSAAAVRAANFSTVGLIRQGDGPHQ